MAADEDFSDPFANIYLQENSSYIPPQLPQFNQQCKS